ncbi:EAL and HDOD domain-containing protein [Polaromonas sp. UC242_47]|uniref:EAL and HDOD domain-containing protein n=1 Tax=Polaromonas sp. UC242_47 TaxID=3374626 RepID=UPI0037AEE7B4
MPENKYLVRAPLLDPKQQVIGYRLAWQKNQKNDESPGEAGLCQLLAFVAERVKDAQLGVVFLDVSLATLPAETLSAMPPKTTVLILTQSDLTNPDNKAVIAALRAQGFGLALCNADLASLTSSEPPQPPFTHLVVSMADPDRTAISRFALHRDPPVPVLIDELPDWREFDACASLGLSGFFGNLCLVPRQLTTSGELGPQGVLILQLMQMVQKNADVHHLEKILKRDATLSYQLFRYINSASFGLEVEIQSLRHAVTMLGYRPLFRWLSLLLATTSAGGFSPALLQAAIVRGRFAELLGQGLLSKEEAENLFFVGMFSLLDQLLGVPLQKVLGQIVLPESVVQALLTREGVYGPFLALVEACEREDGCAKSFSDALFMTATRVNQAHVSALAWAQSLKI